jgi:hypothetical protein
MTRIFAACLLAGATIVVSAPQAGADPQDLLPYCSGDQTPMDTYCRPMAHQEPIHNGSGLSPQLPSGLNPGNPAVVG